MKCTVKYSFNQEPTKLCVWIYSAIAVILEISKDFLSSKCLVFRTSAQFSKVLCK